MRTVEPNQLFWAESCVDKVEMDEIKIKMELSFAFIC